MEHKPQLRVDLIWEDVDIEGVRISASNGTFCGSTQVYLAPRELGVLAETLKGFPKTVEQEQSFAAGAENSYAFASLFSVALMALAIPA